MFKNLEILDQIKIDFSGNSLLFLNISIAIIMVGVALGVRLKRFKKIWQSPKPLVVGIISQIILLPALTFLLTISFDFPVSVALGMLLVASCPGGNVSNFMSSLANGNVELSVSLTMFSSLGAVIFTPLNFLLWGNLYLKVASKRYTEIPYLHIDFWSMLSSIIIILIIPLIIGLLITRFWPKQALKASKIIKNFSIIFFIALIILLLYKNIKQLKTVVELIFILVLIHNAIAISTGYLFAKINKLSRRNTRTISIETGIQNSALALALIFNPKLFNGLGGMAAIAAWWGVWHIISGLTLGFYWSKKSLYA